MWKNFDDFVCAVPMPHELTIDDLWKDLGTMESWLASALFPEITKFDRNSLKWHIDVAPLRFRFSETYLFSLDLLAIASHRPPKAELLTQDFQRIFCLAVVDWIATPSGKYDRIDNEISGNFINEGPRREEPQDLLRWISKAMLLCAHNSQGDVRNSIDAGLLSELLVDKAQSSADISRKSVWISGQTIPMIISIIFALHRNGLWSQLNDALDTRDLKHLKYHFGIMELFINRWADPELHFRRVTTDAARDVYKRFDVSLASRQLDAEWPDILYGLGLNETASELPSILGVSEEQRPIAIGTSHAATSFQTQKGPSDDNQATEADQLAGDISLEVFEQPQLAKAA